MNVVRAIATAGSCALAACSASTSHTAKIPPDLGVAASPLVIAAGEPVPKGGGRYQVGKPYQVAGKWYTPGEDPNYDRVGVASWYGDAFHGRLTANGEVFDSAALSAAHPTLPLPSYVRVTNLGNDRSIIVRVNDRGPFAHTRLIDVSERTAEILDFKPQGMAQVRVEYVDRAHLDGEDDAFLLASYRAPGTNSQDANVMLAAAEPPARRPQAMGGPIVLASLAVEQTASMQAPASAVAFAPGETNAVSINPGALEAVDTLSSVYDADARIAMAFELAGTMD